MDGIAAFLKKHPLLVPLVVSLLFHVLLLLLMREDLTFALSKSDPESESTNEKRMAFEIVESPEHARAASPPEATNLASDKNAMASDLSNADKEDTGATGANA